MDTNRGTQVNVNEEKMNEMREKNYLQKYGVKRFPYRGVRSYTPSISQSVDGGIVISNDVFGLTIKQFERMYVACLERRQTKKQWLLNLRYPDKSSNEYMEYLQNCVYYNRDILPWPGHVSKFKYLYEQLVDTIGTEMHIHERQRLLIIRDSLVNLLRLNSDFTEISSGSLAEGLDLPGSDMDLMCLLNNVDVIQNLGNIKHPIQYTTLLMESNNDHPGFSRLRLISKNKYQYDIITPAYCESTTTGLYLSWELILDVIKRNTGSAKATIHGPCISDDSHTFDIVLCLRCKSFPFSAMQWVNRHRQQWPPNCVIDNIQKYGCLLVPIGPNTMSENRLLWRMSFSVAEKQLVHSFNFTQLLCYGLLKLTLQRIINTHVDVKDLVCSYYLKTALFWVSEEVNIEIFELVRLFYCFSLCIDKLCKWINNCYCPNYFIPTQNMFLGKVDQNNNKKLLSVLDSIKCGGVDGLINNLFPTENVNHYFLSTNSESSFIRLDFFFYRCCGSLNPSTNISKFYKTLQFAESLQMIESSKFIIDSCKYYYGKISQYTVQFLPPPTKTCRAYNLHKRYYRHLKDGIKTDAVSGWLLYASYYYVTGQYNIALRLTEYVLSKFELGMVHFNSDTCTFNKENTNNYRLKVHSKISFKDRIKLAMVDYVTYVWHSSLIPEELIPEVRENDIIITPVVLTYCLRFLCYHHLLIFSTDNKHYIVYV